MKEGFLANLHLPDRPQLLFSFLITIEQLLFARIVSAVAFGCHMLLHIRNLLLRDHLRANFRLNRHQEKLLRNGFLHSFADLFPEHVSTILMHHETERIDGVSHNVYHHFLDVRFGVSVEVVFKAAVAVRHRFDNVNKVCDDFREWQTVFENIPLIF